MRTTLSLVGKACVMLTLSLFAFANASAQLGCTDDLACNYDPAAVTDDGSCGYDGIFLPTTVSAGPAVRACIGLEPAGYYWADQACAETVVANDPFCIDPTGSWDGLCEEDYNNCLGCADPQWYLPYDLGNGLPAVETCAPPAGYYLAPDQACAVSVISDDSYCVRSEWDNICQNAYDACALGCLADYYIPISVGFAPVVYDCSAPAGYILAEQECIEAVVAADPFCLNSTFDGLCSEAYSECLLECPTGSWHLPFQADVGLAPVFACETPPLYYPADQLCLFDVEIAMPGAVTSPWSSAAQELYYGCTVGCVDAQYYIPYQLDLLPAVLTCEDPGDAYFLADQGCIQQTIAANPDCLNTVWDASCQSAYTQCALGCSNAFWAIPIDPEQDLSSPAILSCIIPDGYWVPNQACVTEVIANDDFCVENTWDGICQGSYNSCFAGCIDAEWYIPDAIGVGPAILACSPPAGYSLPESITCFYEVAGQDVFCTLETGLWDGICQADYDSCTNGCTYAFACNYAPNAIYDDGSCNGYPGCTDPTADNYDANATCDNGLCSFGGGTCPGDLDGNLVVNANDLLTFLAAFGNACP